MENHISLFCSFSSTPCFHYRMVDLLPYLSNFHMFTRKKTTKTGEHRFQGTDRGIKQGARGSRTSGSRYGKMSCAWLSNGWWPSIISGWSWYLTYIYNHWSTIWSINGETSIKLVIMVVGNLTKHTWYHMLRKTRVNHPSTGIYNIEMILYRCMYPFFRTSTNPPSEPYESYPS